MKEFEDSETALVADVDCTAAGEELCAKVGVEGYPTLKYGDPLNLQDYDGGREFEDLLNFAKENLGPICGVANLDLCDAEQKAKIETLIAEGIEKLQARITKINEGVEGAETDFEEEVQKLHNRYDKLLKEKLEAIDAVKGEDFGLLSSVHAHFQATAEGHDAEGHDAEGHDEL